MSLSTDLIAQARHLANKEPKKPRQASLRRAVSAAYYALFHFLVSESAVFMVKGPNAPAIRPLFQRAFEHGHMKAVAKAFGGGTLSARWKSLLNAGTVPPDLRDVASAFANLQEARHEADCNVTRRFPRNEAIDLIDVAENAIAGWNKIKNTSEAHVFLVALLVYDKVRS